MSSIKRFILQPIREQAVLFAFLLLMCCLVIPTLCFTTGAFPKPFVWAPPIFDCYLVTLLAYWLRRIRLSWLVWVMCFLLLGGEVFCLLVYQSPYSMTVLDLSSRRIPARQRSSLADMESRDSLLQVQPLL